MSLPSIAKLASKHGIIPLKKYGQNFIYDETLCDRIVRAAGEVLGYNVVEIGPGPAGLTRSILKSQPSRLTVIEMDERCMPLLDEIKDVYPNLNIINNDALKVPLSSISNKPVKIIANLPYNIGCKLLTNWLEEIESVSSITIMLQKEVVDRIIAEPNTKQYGRLSIFCQMLCDVHKCFDVSPKAFYPEPKVHSAIVHLTPKSTIIPKNLFAAVEKITAHAFNNRRKMLRSTLKTIIPNIDEILQQLNIPLTARAENLSVQNFLDIAVKLERVCINKCVNFF